MAATPLVATTIVLVMGPVAVGLTDTPICARPPLVSVPTLKVMLDPLTVYGYDTKPKPTLTNWAVAGIVLVTTTVCDAPVRLVTLMLKVRLLLIPTGFAEAITLSHMSCAPARVPTAINAAANTAIVRNLEKNFMLITKPMRFRT
jgi:hypothetical protein